MASIDVNIRMDSDLKEQTEQILSQLGMNLNGTINMFLRQVVRDRAVPLSLSLRSEQSLYADLLRARMERAQGIEGVPIDKLLTDMDQIIAEVEHGENV